MPKDILAEICAVKREHVAQCKARAPQVQVDELAQQASKPRGFKKALDTHIAQGKIALIAEIKKASPSRGLIRADFQPSELAKAYEQGGAACLSVLTDEPYFQGNDAYIKQARDAVQLPVLRKDFMLDPYQVTEARALGADCILLIMAALTDDEASQLETEAFALGMDVLVEVHDEAELERALKLKTKLLGINNRNLKTLEISLDVSRRLSKLVPENAGYTLVCESGIYTPQDIESMREIGIHTFLVGESLMRQQDVAAATKALLGH